MTRVRLLDSRKQGSRAPFGTSLPPPRKPRKFELASPCGYGLSLPLLRFQVLLTLSPEFFASFAHASALSDYPPVFSFRWSLPPNLHTDLKVYDSRNLYPDGRRVIPRGYHPLWHSIPRRFWTISGRAQFTKLQFERTEVR